MAASFANIGSSWRRYIRSAGGRQSRQERTASGSGVIVIEEVERRPERSALDHGAALHGDVGEPVRRRGGTIEAHAPQALAQRREDHSRRVAAIEHAGEFGGG